MFLALVLAGVGVMSAAGQARIVRVEREMMVEAETSFLQMPKFLDESASTAGEVYRVEWEPVGVRISTGAVVQFDYVQERVAKAKRLQITYPFPVETRRKATFTIAEDAYRRGGDVERWRVRVVDQGRVVAERVSGAWERL